MFRYLILSTLFATLSSFAVHGQVLVQQMKPLKGTAGKPLTDQVVFAIAGAGVDATTCRGYTVEFTPVGGNAAVQPSTDDGDWDGTMCTVRTTWTLGTIPSQELDVRIRNKPATRIIVKAVAEPPKPSPSIQFVGKSPGPGVAGMVLPTPIKVRITPNGAACSKYLVEFQSSGDGAAKPSTSPAVSNGTECVATTNWKLPTFDWSGDQTASWLTATLKLDGKSQSTAATRADLVVPNELEIDVKSPWGYVERDLGRPVSAKLSFPQIVDCRSAEVTFQASGDGSISPLIVRGEDQLAKTCEFSTRWTLGKSPGKQQIQARVSKAGAISAKQETIARTPPRIIGGILVVPNGVAPDSIEADSKTSSDLEETASVADAEADSVEKRPFVAVAGLDFPFAALMPRAWSGQNSILHRIRLVAATEFGANAFKAIYFGLNLSVATSRLATEANPISLVAGYRVQQGGDNRVWFGVIVGAEDLISPLTKGLGL